MCMSVLYVYMHITCVPGATGGQKSVLDPLVVTDGSEPPGECSEWNLDPL